MLLLKITMNLFFNYKNDQIIKLLSKKLTKAQIRQQSKLLLFKKFSINKTKFYYTVQYSI